MKTGKTKRKLNLRLDELRTSHFALSRMECSEIKISKSFKFFAK